ncbi:DUF1697 domain-containing protein [Geodermatophilus sp. URMC 64]
MSTRYVALLRGINLGKARQVDMPRLRAVLTAAGHGDVRTYLRSGNVLLDSPLPEADLATQLTREIEKEFGFEVPVVIRTGDELAAVLEADPLGAVATDPARYSVTFFPEAPAEARIAELPPAEDGEYVVRGRELYLWLPGGMADSAMAKWKWDRLLGVAGTNRNWNTVSKLAELAAG